jgi:hypothetical protein
MDDHHETELGMRILPAIDLTLWLRIFMLMILAAVAVGITVAVR